jgi:hypothetical protein
MKPRFALRFVLRHTVTVEVKETEQCLGFGVTLLGSFAIPERSLCIVLGHTFAIFVHRAKATLRRSLAVDGLLFEGSDILCPRHWVSRS